MVGGLGDDVYIVDSRSDRVTEAYAAGGKDTVHASTDFSIALSGYVEDVYYSGTAVWGQGNAYHNMLSGEAVNGIELEGLGGNDKLIGSAGDDILDGGTGRDTMEGGDGDDTYWVSTIGDSVAEEANQGTDLVKAFFDYGLGNDVENLELYGSADSGVGNSLDNTIWGNSTQRNYLGGKAGNDTLIGKGNRDTLDGGEGDDTMVGGDGNDTYVVDSAGDTVSEDQDEGSLDKVEAHVDYSLVGSGEVEILTLLSTADWGEGNEYRNTINGNTTLANRLFGLGEHDRL